MIAASFLVVVAVVGVSLPPADACTYWCMNPATRQYVCCDEGNPWYNGGSEEPAAEEIGDGAVVADYVVDSGLADGADAGSSSGCVYYCNYNSQVYCCDNGEGPREYFNPQYYVPQHIGPHHVPHHSGPQYHVPQYIGPNHIPQHIGPHHVPQHLGPQYHVPQHIGPDHIPQHIGPNHVPQHLGPHVMETLNPEYIVRPVPGYGGSPQSNPFGLLRIVDEDIEEETRDSGSPFNIASMFRNPLTAIFNSGDETEEISQGFNHRRYFDHVVNSPTLGRLAFDSLLNMIPSGFADERVETSKSLAESNLDKRQINNDDGLNLSSTNSSNDSLSIPILDNLTSLFFGNGEDDTSMITESGRAEKEELDIPIVSPVPLVNSFSISNPSVENSLSRGVPLVPIENLFVSTNHSDLNSVSNEEHLLPVVKNSVSEGTPLIPIENSLPSSNPSYTKSVINGVPLIPIINSVSVSDTLGKNTNSSGVSLIPLDNFFPYLNQLAKHRVSDTQNIDVSQSLTQTQGIPLPFKQGQSNTAFVMQHILQQPEMANAVMHSQKSPVPPFVPTKGTLQENIIDLEASIGITEKSSKAETPVTTVTTESSLKTEDALDIKEDLSKVSTLPINVSEEILSTDVTSTTLIPVELDSNSKAEIQLTAVVTESHLKTKDALDIKEYLSEVSTLPIIESENNLSSDLTNLPVIPLALDEKSILSHKILLTETENPSFPHMYGTFSPHIAPQKQNSHVPTHYPLYKRLQSQHTSGSIPFSNTRYPYPSYPHTSYPPHNKGYPMPSTKQYMRPIRPFIDNQTPKSYPKLMYNPPSVSVTPDFILTGSDTPGIPSAGLTPPSKDLRFFSHIPASISDKLIAPPNKSISDDEIGDLVTDDVLDLVMNINKATCLCLESGERKNDTSCPCSIKDLVVVFPPTPGQPYLLLPLSKSKSLMEKHSFDKINTSLSGEELITSTSEYSIQKISPENKHITVSKKTSENKPKQRQQNFLEVLKRFHNLSNQIDSRTLSDILGNSSKLPKVEIDNDQIEEIIHSESSNASKSIPSSS